MNWNAFKRLFHYLGRYKLRLILVMIAAVLSTLFTVLTPAVTGGITSELYDGVASGSFDWETIVWLAVRKGQNGEVLTLRFLEFGDVSSSQI